MLSMIAMVSSIYCRPLARHLLQCLLFFVRVEIQLSSWPEQSSIYIYRMHPELLLLHFSLLHSCRFIQAITADRPSIYRRAPTLLQLQHLLQYQRSLPTSVAVLALASVAVPATATKWELLLCISDPQCFCYLLLQHFSRRFRD
jgi:hypothetical protein